MISRPITGVWEEEMAYGSSELHPQRPDSRISTQPLLDETNYPTGLTSLRIIIIIILRLPDPQARSGTYGVGISSDGCRDVLAVFALPID